MSGKLFQGVLNQIKDKTQFIVGVLDESATVIACTEAVYIGDSFASELSEVLSAEEDGGMFNEYLVKSIGSLSSPDLAVFVKGSGSEAEMIANMLTATFSSMRTLYDEKYNKTNFIKNVMLENILAGDLYVKSKEQHLNMDLYRVVFIIRLLDKTDFFAHDIIQSLFPEKGKDFVINLSDTDIALIKEVRPGTEAGDLEKLARSISDTLNSEFYSRSTIGIGSIVSNLRDLPRSYKEAQVAIEVGKVFDIEKTILSYEHLGIGRLIYYLPTTLCNMFLSEIFKRDSIDSLDHETLFTIQKFFENNLNVSETSRKLFVHRNTLVYRLEKIRRLTGLDLKEFDDAIVFKVALMVKKYLASNPTKY